MSVYTCATVSCWGRRFLTDAGLPFRHGTRACPAPRHLRVRNQAGQACPHHRSRRRRPRPPGLLKAGVLLKMETSTRFLHGSRSLRLRYLLCYRRARPQPAGPARPPRRAPGGSRSGADTSKRPRAYPSLAAAFATRRNRPPRSRPVRPPVAACSRLPRPTSPARGARRAHPDPGSTTAGPSRRRARRARLGSRRRRRGSLRRRRALRLESSSHTSLETVHEPALK